MITYAANLISVKYVNFESDLLLKNKRLCSYYSNSNIKAGREQVTPPDALK